MQIYRQGDVLIVKTDKGVIPDTHKTVKADQKRTVLAYGEVTGHCHQLPAQTTSLYEWQGSRLLEVKKTSSLTHEEHATITLEPGIYEVVQQREYTPQAIRNVSD